MNEFPELLDDGDNYLVLDKELNKYHKVNKRAFKIIVKNHEIFMSKQ